MSAGVLARGLPRLLGNSRPTLQSLAIQDIDQSRSQSMPVCRLVVGKALAKRNEICNLIGCREISKTDISKPLLTATKELPYAWRMRLDSLTAKIT